MRFQVSDPAHSVTLFSQSTSKLKADFGRIGKSGELSRTNPRLKRPGGVWVAMVGAMLLWAGAAGAQVALLTPAYPFATSAVVGGAVESATVQVTISGAGSLKAISVLTQGVANRDFTIGVGSTCQVGASYFAGQTCTVPVSFEAKYPGFRQGAVVLVASNGSVLGTRLLSGTGLGPTAVFVPGMMTSVAGNGQWIYHGDGNLATSSSLFLPEGGAADASGNLYLSDSNNQRIRFVNAATGLISTVAGFGTPGFGGDGGLATLAMLATPADVKLDGAGNFYIADSANHAIRMVNAATGIIWTVAGMGGQSGYSGDGGAATKALLNSPSGIAFDGDHTLYISDTVNNAIRKVDLSTGIITTVAGNGVVGYSGDGRSATLAELNYPWGIALGIDGSLYIADLGNNCVRRVSTGVISTVVGTGVLGYSGDSGPANQAQLNGPADVLVDVAGNLYVADSGNQVVRKVNAATGVIATIAGTESKNFSGDGGPANVAALYAPYALFLDGPGNLYIADMFNQRIRMVSSNVAALIYLPMRVDRTSAPQLETIENDGNATLNFTAFNLVSNSALDLASTTCVTGQQVLADLTCVLGVEFAPLVTGTPVGTPVTGSLSATTDAANSPSVVDLSGLVLSVNPTTETLTSDSNPAPLGTMVKFIATVLNQVTTVATGTVTFSEGAVLLDTETLDATGACAFSTKTLPAGSHTITAVYGGDLQNNVATHSLIEIVQQPTTTVLTSSATTSVAGAPVTFTATVAGPLGSTEPPPSGAVTFFDSGTAIGPGTLNPSGVATLTISTLGVGPRSITANYQGDTLDIASQSVPLIETVNPAATATSLTTSNANVFAGVSVIFTALVSRIDGMIPTGTVTFLDGATTIGTGTLDVKGTATLTTAALAGGPHTISATYGGDANDGASSGTVTETVQAIATATTVTTSVNPGIAGASLQLTATVVQTGATGTGGVFTGTVTFMDGATPLGFAPVSAKGIATLNAPTLPVGSHNIIATYSGNANYVLSTSVPLVEVISSASTTTVLKSSGPTSIAGLQVILTATVTGTGGTPTGTVTVTDSAGPTLGPVTLINGIATLMTSTLAVGPHTLTAVYSSDPNDTASTSAPQPLTVLIATSNTKLGSSLNPSAFGANVTFTAIVTTNGGAAAGTVTFSDGTTVLGPPAPVTAGTATFSTSALALGPPHSIIAAYSGDLNDTASQSTPFNQQVQQAGRVTLNSSGSPSIAGTNVTFTATIDAPQGVAVTGTVTFKEGATVLGTGGVSSLGVALFSTSALAVAQHFIVASYSGDANNQAASSLPFQQIVRTADTIVTLQSSANPSLTTAPLTLTATVVGTGGIITGTVTFQDGTTPLGGAPLSGAGVATLVVNGLAPGLHSIVAVYNGDANNLQNFSPALAQSVLQATIVTVSSSENPSLALDAVPFTAAVGNGGGKTPTGTIVFSDGTNVLGTVTLSAAGTATFTASSLTVGTHAITASYAGDSLNTKGVSTALSQQVLLRPTSDTLTASSTSLTGGQQVTLISVVRFAGPVTPTGAVIFLSSGVMLGTSVVDNTGVATLTVILMTSAPTVTASYSGDSVYAASTSTQTSITVAKPTQFTMQLSPAAVTMQSQQNSTTMLTITSLHGFADTLDLGCLGLPFAATCTFAQDQVALAANGSQSIQVVIDTGSPLTAGSQARLEQHGAGSLAAMCILPGGALLGLVFWRGRRKMRTRLAGLTVLLLLVGLSAGLSGCGGLHINGTPPGTYVIQVSATGAGTGVTQAIDVTVTVTQ